MGKPRRRRYLKQCLICERDFYTTRKDTVTCSQKCRQQYKRDRDYVPEKAGRVLAELHHLTELLDSEPFQDDAWRALVGLHAYLSKVVTARAVAWLDASVMHRDE